MGDSPTPRGHGRVEPGAKPGRAPATATAAAGDSARRRALEYVSVLLAAGVLYVASAAPGPLWQDSGLAQCRVVRNDIVGSLGLALAHPLYYVLAAAFQALPLTESAYKTNLVSAVFGAITIANLYVLLRALSARRSTALAGAAALAVAHTFWQHAALAEVYTVTTALLTLELLALVRLLESGERRWLALLFLCNGLGVSNHMVAVLNLPIDAIAALWALRGARGGARRVAADVVLAGSVWLAGAALYLGLIGSEIAHGAGAGETIRSALFGHGYAQNVLNLRPSLSLLGRSLLYVGLNFPTPALLLAPIGLVALWKSRSRRAAGALAALLLIHFAWAARYNVPDQYTFFIPAYVFIALLIGLGAERLLAGRNRRLAVAVLAAVLLPVLVYIPLPQLARAAGLDLGLKREVPFRDSYAYFLHPWKTGEKGPLRFAEYVKTLPADAVLVADGTTVRPLQYMQLTGRWRSDLRIYPEADGADDDPRFTEASIAVELAAGRVYVVTPQPKYVPAWMLDATRFAFERDGPIYRMRYVGP